MDINARQIEPLDYNYLEMDKTLQYSKDQLDRVKANAALMAKLGNEVNDWENATDAFDEANKRPSTANATKALETLDKERDSYYTGFAGTVSNALKSPNQAHREAAEQLMEPIKRYKVNSGSEYQQQTSRITQLCQDLLANFTTQLATLGLTEWVLALQAKNVEFNVAMTTRTNDQAGHIKNELKLLRENIIKAYRKFVKLANVVFIYEGDEAYATTIDQLNAEVKHYKDIIARKTGKGSAAGGSGSGSGSSSDGESGNGGSESGGETPENPGGTDNTTDPTTPTDPTDPTDPENPGGGSGDSGNNGGGGSNDDPDNGME